MLMMQKPNRKAYEDQLITKSSSELEKKIINPSPFRWTGSKDRIFDAFEEIFPNSLSVNVGNKNSSISRIGSLFTPTSSSNSGISKHMQGIKCVVEPFMGGASMSVYLYQSYPEIDKFFGCDILSDMINFYWILKYYYDEFMVSINALLKNYNEVCTTTNAKADYFMEVREWYNQMMFPLQSEDDGISVERAAGFYFLHLTSFNQSYRTNKKGLFNSTSSLIEEANIPEGSIETVKEMLDTKFNTALCDYKESIDYIKHLINPSESFGEWVADENAQPIKPNEIFVYLDPPSAVHKLPGDHLNPSIFVYSSKTVSELADFCNSLSDLGVKWLLTMDGSCKNSFLNSCNYLVNTKPLINTAIRNPSKRVNELYIYNYNI